MFEEGWSLEGVFERCGPWKGVFERCGPWKGAVLGRGHLIDASLEGGV